jgi:O-antigen/teichoic acid export membrane protein
MAWFTRDVTRTLMAQGPVLAFGLAASILTARVLGPTDRGIYALCFMIASTAVFFGTLHMGQSLAYHIGRRGLSAERTLSAALLLTMLLGVAVFAVLRLAAPLLLRFFEHLRPDALELITIAAPLMLANGILTQFFRAMDRIDRFNLCRIVGPGIRLAALAVAFALGGRLLEALRAVIVAELLLLPLQLGLLRLLARPRFRESPGDAASLARFGARLEGAAAIGQIDLRLAGFMVAIYCSAADIGYYAIAEGIVTYVLAVPTLVGNVLLPKIARDDDRKAARMTAATCRSTVFLTVAVSALIAALSRPLVLALYGAEYLPSALTIAVLLPMAIGRSGVRILAAYIIVADRVRILALANTAALVVNAPLLLLLVPTHGILGAAAAASAAHLLYLLIVAAAFGRLTGMPLRAVLLVERTDLTRMWQAGLDAVSLRALRPSGGDPR